MLSGVGGQGLQLIAKTLAVTATQEDRRVLVSSEYGGAMRGGHSLATVVIGDGPLRALPVVPEAASALAMHERFWEDVLPRLTPSALVVVNSSQFDGDPGPGKRVVSVPADDIAQEVATPLSSGFVLMGAYIGVTGIVDVDRASAAIGQIIPPYRRQHIEANQRALHAGAQAVDELSRPVWQTEVEIT